MDRWLTSTVGKWKWGSFEEGINHHSSIFWWWSNYMLELLCSSRYVTRTQCLPPDVWGPTQMLNINIIQCNWTSVTKYTELRASGELTCSALLQMDWEWQRGNLISWMSTKLPTALALWIYGGSIHARSAWAKYILTNIQCPVLNSYSSLHAAIWRLMPSCPGVWGTRLFSVTSLERRNPSLLNWNIQQTTDHLGIHDQGLSMVIWIGPNKIEEQGKLPV